MVQSTISEVPIVCLVILFDGLFRGSLAKKKTCYHFAFVLPTEQLSQLFLAKNSYIECLDVSVFFFPTAVHCTASSAMCSWAGQPRSRSKVNRSFPKNFRRRLHLSFPCPPCSLRGFRDPGSELESESGILEFLKKFPTLCLVP